MRALPEPKPRIQGGPRFFCCFACAAVFSAYGPQKYLHHRTHLCLFLQADLQARVLK
jgi:hypothetical protein